MYKVPSYTCHSNSILHIGQYYVHNRDDSKTYVKVLQVRIHAVIVRADGSIPAVAGEEVDTRLTLLSTDWGAGDCRGRLSRGGTFTTPLRRRIKGIILVW